MTVNSGEPIAPIENYDPLGNFLTQTVHLTPLSFGLVVFLANVIVDAWLGWRYDVLVTESGLPGILQDLTAVAADFVQIPVIAGLYLWTKVGATTLFQQLQQARVFKAESVLIENVNHSRPIFCSRRAFYLILVISLGYAFYQLGTHLGWLPTKPVEGYLTLYPQMSYARAPFWFLGFYTMLYSMFNIAITVIILRRLFRIKEIQLLPLHPDRCGGLVSISQYSLKIGYGIASLGLVISAAAVTEFQHGTLEVAYPVWTAIVAYIIFAPLFFFWPLGTAHQAMSEAKEAELLSLANQFDRVYDRVKQEGINQDKQYDDDMKRLDHIKKLYEISLEFPVWPFDIQNLRRFFAVVTAPLIPAAISILVDIITNLFSL